jgi:hypothetical protein
MAANPDEGTVLQHLEQFGLDREIQTADLIQKQGTVMRLLDAAEFGRHGACERSLFIAKQLSFEQGVRDSGAAYFDQGASGTHRERVQEANADLLAGAALALDQNGDVGLSDPFQLIADSLHCGRFAEDDIKRRQI